MGIELVIASVALGVAVAGTAVSAISANKAAKAQQKLQRLRSTQQRRSQVREARIRRGRVANIAAQTGTQGSSGALGAQGSIQTQLATNLSFLDRSLGFAQTISSQQARAQTFSAIAGLGGKVFGAVGGAGQISSALGLNTPSTAT